MPADQRRAVFGVGLLQLLDAAATNSTYKYALLVALIDSATESVGARGGPRGSVTTEALARRVIGLYWLQSREWHDRRSRATFAESGGTPSPR